MVSSESNPPATLHTIDAGFNAAAFNADKPQQADLDRCVHCGLCLNACPTYRDLGLEMDSPRGRIYQMARVAAGEPISPAYLEHIDLCLACRACESACPSGVPYGRLVEDARAEIETQTKRGWLTRQARGFLFGRLLPSSSLLIAAGALLYLYQASGLQSLLRKIGLPRLLGGLGDREALLPDAEIPFFFREYGKTFPALGEHKHRVAFVAGCIANISFARLNESTVRVLRASGCEVVIPAMQTCCGALHNHAGMRDMARRLARQNIDAFAGIDADMIVTNAAGCGSTLKEYGELLAHDPDYAEKACRFSAMTKDVTELLASIGFDPKMKLKPINATVTYQDSCHLAHGQKIRSAPRQLLRAVPGLEFREMPMADSCCGSAGIYNALHTDMSMRILEKKMSGVNTADAQIIATANPGCMLQLRAGVRKWGQPGVRVAHVIEILDEALSLPDL